MYGVGGQRGSVLVWMQVLNFLAFFTPREFRLFTGPNVKVIDGPLDDDSLRLISLYWRNHCWVCSMHSLFKVVMLSLVSRFAVTPAQADALTLPPYVVASEYLFRRSF